MQQRFIAWIEGKQEYKVGVELYLEFGTNAMLKKVLASGESSYNKKKLLEEIQKLFATLPEQEIKTAAQIITRELPKEELKKELEKERTACFKTAAHLKAQLPLIQSLEKRRAIAYKILDLYDRNAEIWAMLEYEAKHGCFPNAAQPRHQEPEPESLEIAEIQRRLLVIRPKVSRYKDNPNKQKEYQQLLQQKFNLEQMLTKAKNQ